ncbi:CASP-like protein 4A4 [Euphorbia lathyris]|uniref:CASP-like protein 4A4 n=1 Tax=Euphorbia lathyris TaxID=212925 RepID=UPI003313AB77
MKKQDQKLVVASSTPMASSAQSPYPTPSPFSFSVTSSRWSSRPPIDRTTLVLRSFAFLLSFLSAVLLASSASSNKNHHHQDHLPYNFTRCTKLMYCFVVYILVFVYSAFQLFKGVCDIAHRGILISDHVSDYSTFILDQLTGYFLVSSCSVAIMAIQQNIGRRNTSFWNAIVASTSMSFATFLVIATCSVLSGYKLCKRIIW